MEAREFQCPVSELIKVRSSWRSFDKRDIPNDLKARLKAAIADPPQGPFGNGVRCVLLEKIFTQDNKPLKLGTYGVIQGANNFIAGVVGKGEQALEDFGYVFEWIVLQATSLGLATCWLGGTFQRDSFSKVLGVEPHELIPAVSPVGYARGKRSMVDTVFRWAAASKKRKPFSELFFDQSFESPLTEKAAEEYSQVLEMVRLGPSASNKQPWRILRDSKSQKFHFFLKRSGGYLRHLAVDLQRIDMGIGMCHFELSTREYGLPGKWTIEPPPIDRLPERTTYLATWNVD